MRFQGKVVTITGAGSGIGLEIARAFAREGARVVLSDVDPKLLERAVEEVSNIQADARGVVADVTRPADLAALLDDARSTFGQVDVHVNNAGVLTTGPFDALSDADVERHIRVNLLGVMYGTRAAVRIMRDQGSGHVVNIASLAGLAGVPGAAAYSASKFGVRGFTLSAAGELRDTSIHLTTVCPDAVETPMVDRAASEAGSPLIFSGTMLKPEAVAAAVLDVIEKPRPEICLPRHRGIMAKIGSFFPSMGDRTLPQLEKLGEKAIARYQSEKGRS